jgi:hypothetical protein
MEEDDRIVWGATPRCTWWGPVVEANGGTPVPTCPRCGSVLLESSKEKWDAGIKDYMEKTGDENYSRFLDWVRTDGKCGMIWSEIRRKFAEATGTPYVE